MTEKAKRNLNFGDLNVLKKYFALIYGSHDVWDGTNRMMMGIADLRLAYGRNCVNMWLESDECKKVKVKDVLFAPGVEVDEGQINLFAGFDIEPLECNEDDVRPMLNLLNYLCSSASAPDDVGGDSCSDDVAQWVLRWLAYPLQHVGAKMRTALVFHGDEGAGKNLFFDAMRDLYGEYGIVVGQDQLDDKFNDWASRRLFIVGDEVLTRSELVHHKNKLKGMITGKEIQISGKFRSVRTESNHMNVVFLSNELQPLSLDNTDRRYCVVFTPPAREKAFYSEVAGWLYKQDGLRKWMYYLMHCVDLADFDENTKPPMTQSKADLMDLSARSSERFVVHWLGGELDLPAWDCTTDQIYRAYLKWCVREGERFPRSKNVFCREAIRRAAGSVRRDEVNDEGGTRKIRFWAVDTPEHLEPAPEPLMYGNTPAGRIRAMFRLFEDRLEKYLKDKSND